MIRRGACVVVVVGLLSAVAAQAASPRYVPPAVRQQIVAYFGRTLLPGWLPRGYVYSRWGAATGTNARYLNVSFGDHGRLVEWTVDDPADPKEAYSHQACAKHPFGHVVKVLGKRIVYAGGAVGQTATLCINKSKAVTVWGTYGVTPKELQRIAASARPVG